MKAKKELCSVNVTKMKNESKISFQFIESANYYIKEILQLIQYYSGMGCYN